jgi:hypothetical protein
VKRWASDRGISPNLARRTGRLLAASLLCAALLPGTGVLSSRHQAVARGVQPTAQRTEAVRDAYARLPARFEANRGQADPDVRFVARGNGYSLSLSPGGATLALDGSKANRPDEIVTLRAVGANPAPQVVGVDQLPGTTNYMLGDDPSQWQTGVPGYSSVRYRHIYPGVDLVFHGGEGQLEYDFVLAPGADPRAITLAFDGVKGIAIQPSGDLALSTGSGDVVQKRPTLYQEIDGKRRSVPGAYVMQGGDRVGFSVGAFERTRPLVIDPVLTYSSFLGAAGDERGRAIAVDSTGAAYITGETSSASFRTRGAAQAGFMNETDVFVTKLSTTASGDASLVYSTYLGGSRDESGIGIAVDARGRAWVTGETTSRKVVPTKSDTRLAEDAFPTTAGAYQSAFQSVEDPKVLTDVKADAFVALLDTNLSGPASLVYSTYLGSPGVDVGTGIAVDPGGRPWVAGYTNSAAFPTTPGVHKRTKEDTKEGNKPVDEDIFLARLDPSKPQPAESLVSTYLGGTGNDRAGGVAVDKAGNGYVTGVTRSTDFPTSTNFPTEGASFQPAPQGAADAFVAKLDQGVQSLLYSTYFGGGQNDAGYAIAVNSSGRAFITGQTQSAQTEPGRFPVTPNAYQTVKPLGLNGFVSALDTAGPTPGLAYSTYLGGSSVDGFSDPPSSCVMPDPRCRGERGSAIALTGEVNALVTGETNAPDFLPPTTAAGAFQPEKAGGFASTDAFLARIDVSASGPEALVYGSSLGGNAEDAGNGVAADPAGNAYVTGDTLSSDLPVIDGAFQERRPGGSDAFVAKIGTADDITPRVTELAPRGGPTGGGTTVKITGKGFEAATRVSFGSSEVPVVSSSDTEITVTSPKHAEGPVNLTVHVGQARSFVNPSARFYYGDEGNWRPTQPMTTARHAHTATLLRDGRVLVAGGAGLTTPDPTRLDQKRPPSTETEALGTAELYNPRTETWASVGGLVPRSSHTATLLQDGRILVVGGRDEKGDALSSAQLYNTATGSWTPAGAMRDARYGHTATLLPSGKVLVVGGAAFNSAASGSAEIYDPGADPSGAWTRLQNMTDVRYGHTATLLSNGTVLVVGGATSSRVRSAAITGVPTPEVNASAEIYNPAADTWTFTCPQVNPQTKQPVSPCVGPGTRPNPRLFHTATALPDGRVLVAGGRFSLIESAIGRSAELYDPAADPTKAWSFVTQLKTGRTGHAGVSLPSGRPFVAGGLDPNPLGNGEAFDVAAGAWRGAPAMASLRGSEQGSVRVVSSSDLREVALIPGPTATLLSADPSSFKLDGPAEPARCGANCGKILVVGGSREATAEGRRVAELYTPAAAILGVEPNRGDPKGGYPVTIKGTGFTDYLVSGVRFGDAPAARFRVIDYFTIEAIAPAAPKNRTADVVVETDGGLATARRGFLFKGPPDGVTDLAATAVSSSEVKLTFKAAGSNGDNPPPANKYLVKQTSGPLATAQDFDAAPSLCGRACTFSPAKVDDGLTLTITGLSPSTAYRYALRAQDDEGTLGAMSNTVEVTTRAGPVPAAQRARRATAARSAGPAGRSVQVAGPTNPAPAPPAETQAVQLSSQPVIPGAIGEGTTRRVIPKWLIGLLVVSLLVNLATLGAFLNRRYRGTGAKTPSG